MLRLKHALCGNLKFVYIWREMSLFSEKTIIAKLLLKSIKIIKECKCSNGSTWKSSYTADFLIAIL